MTYRDRNRKLETSTAPTKARSREPAYSQALNQNKIDRHEVKIQRVRQADRQAAKADGVWCSDDEGEREKYWIQDVKEQCFQFRVKDLWRGRERWSFGDFV